MSVETGTTRSIEQIAVLGLGNVGGLIADMLAERGFDVQGVDADSRRAADDGVLIVDVADPEATASLCRAGRCRRCCGWSAPAWREGSTESIG